MHKVNRKILSLVLACTLILTNSVPLAASAAGNAPTGGEIIAFAELPQKTAKQEVLWGTTVDELILPSTLAATVRVTTTHIQDSGHKGKDSGKPEPKEDIDNDSTQQAVSVPVLQWIPQPEYDPETLGTYTFTPVLDDSWSLAENVELPAIIIKVEALAMPATLSADVVEAKNVNIDLTHLTPDNSGWVSNGQKVYVGQYGGNPTAYRVLEINMTDETMLLDSDKNLVARRYGASGQIWPNSEIRTWLTDNFYSDGAVFHDIERAAIVETDSDDDGPYTIESNSYTQGYSFTDYGAEDHIFLLTARQVDELYSDAAARIKNSSWRTRSSDGVGTFYVNSTGEYAGVVVDYDGIGIAPAFNLNMESVILTSAAGANKASSLIETMDGSGINEWKLTLKDNAQSLTLGEESRSGDTITIPYTYSYSGTGTDATQISAMITKGDRMESGSTVKYYGKVSTGNITQGNGSVTFNLPVNYDPSTDEIYIFSEQVNGNSLSDYASEPQKIIANAGTPSITISPQNGIYNQGATATELSVVASIIDGGTLSYQWYSNTTDNNTSGTLIPDAMAASYTPDTNTVGELYYYCEVTNTNTGVIGAQTATATSTAAKITINALVNAETPNITAHPQSVTYRQGNSAVPLSVTASVTDGGILSYQWYSNTTDNNTGGTLIPGATAASDTPDTNTVGEWYYYCEVTNTNTGVNGAQTATATSTAAKVTVTNNGTGGSSSDNDSTPSNSTGNISVYGIHVPYAIHNASGVMTLDLTSAILDQVVIAAGTNKTIAINAGSRAELKELVVNFPPSWFANHTNITIPVQSGIGGITLGHNLAKQFPAQNVAAMVSLQTGSLIFSAKQNGNTVTWKDANAPVSIYMPYVPPMDSNTHAIVLYNKSTGKTVAHSFYSGGTVSAAVNGPGTYDAKIGTSHFADTQGHLAIGDIIFAFSHGLLSGTSATNFSPDTAMTRADFVVALGKLAGIEASSYTISSFTDVANDNPAMPYIEWAVANKIIQGIGNKKFEPNQAITREQIAAMLTDYAKATGQTLPKVHAASTFADSKNISVWANEAVKAVQQAELMAAKAGNLFDPQGTATRAEAATILHRFAKATVHGEKGWVHLDAGQWRYIDHDYLPRKGWLVTIEGYKYYFDANGLMVSDKWMQIDGAWYYFYSDGKMARNTIIEGYIIDENGLRKTK